MATQEEVAVFFARACERPGARGGAGSHVSWRELTHLWWILKEHLTQWQTTPITEGYILGHCWRVKCHCSSSGLGLIVLQVHKISLGLKLLFKGLEAFLLSLGLEALIIFIKTSQDSGNTVITTEKNTCELGLLFRSICWTEAVISPQPDIRSDVPER